MQADLSTFRAHGVLGAAVVTAVTVQDREGVHAVTPVAPDEVAAQVLAVLRTAPPTAVKTGMLASPATIEAVALALAPFEGPLVVDPVLAATGGASLLAEGGVAALARFLLPRSRVLTPNLAEAAVLLGEREIAPGTEPEAARALAEHGPDAVLLTGGHAETDPVVDWLFAEGRSMRLGLPRVPGAPGHGTGCALSASLAARLGRGEALVDAVQGAKRFVHRALAASAARGDGWRLDHTVPAD